jgi:hypothetical protein
MVEAIFKMMTVEANFMKVREPIIIIIMAIVHVRILEVIAMV